jgi:hypothetical protein
MREVVEQGGPLPICLSICIQRAALKAPPPSDARSLSQNPLRGASARCGLLPPRQAGVPFHRSSSVALGVGRDGTPVGQACTASSGQTKKNGAKHIINKIILIGLLGQNAEAKTAQNNREYVTLNLATQESWKNDKGDYENRTEWQQLESESDL